MEKKKDNFNGYMVSTRCYTYNHAPYIEETLHGFAIQKTSFPVVFCVVDDASTDGEQEVLKKWVDYHLISIGQSAVWEEKPYGKLAVGNLKGNEHSTFVVLLLSENHNSEDKIPLKLKYIEEWNRYAKYCAFCEGDDYWIDSYKLQKQVEYLDNHPGYAMCYTRLLINDNGIVSSKPTGGPRVDFCDLLRGNTVATVTTLFRKDVDIKYFEVIRPEKRHWKMGDYPRWLWMSEEWKIGFIEDVTAVYRILPESASHSKSLQKRLSFIDSEYDIRSFFNDYYQSGMERVLLKDHYVYKLYVIAQHGDIGLACDTYINALRKDWTILFIPKLYIYLIRTLSNRIKKGINHA